MKKIFTGSLAGAIIMFTWGFLSWTILPLHLHTFMYNPVQDSVLNIMASNNVATGAYLFPMVDNRNITAFDSKYHEESEKLMQQRKGTPMATVYYLKEGYDMSGLTILRGFIFNFFAVFAACIILAPAFGTMTSFFGRWWLSLVVAFIVSACGPLMNYNWMGVPWSYTADMVLDTFLNWGVTGLWLAWYFGRK